MDENGIGERVLGAAIKVHKALGPGLLENAYEACLAHEIERTGLAFERQPALPVTYDSMRIDLGYRLDLLVAGKVVVEVKAIEVFLPVHSAQLLSYLKLGGFKLGYLINFNVARLADGIKRMVNGL